MASHSSKDRMNRKRTADTSNAAPASDAAPAVKRNRTNSSSSAVQGQKKKFSPEQCKMICEAARHIKLENFRDKKLNCSTFAKLLMAVLKIY